jgi:hypothetical protein
MSLDNLVHSQKKVYSTDHIPADTNWYSSNDMTVTIMQLLANFCDLFSTIKERKKERKKACIPTLFLCITMHKHFPVKWHVY